MTLSRNWQAHLVALTAALLALIALFHRDALDMAGIWWNISTYSHCLFIPAIVGWLIWQRRTELAVLEPSSWWPGLLLFAVGAFGWMLGEAGNIALFRHAALILMIQATVLTILGPTVTRGILFPIFYLTFLIPFGDEFVPLLQTITAKLCMIMLSIVQLPAHIDGVFITTPSGYFEVAEACSGVKFLVAMVAYSTLVANVCFKSWKRRISFMVMAALVSVLANGFRAFSTIYISHLTSIEFASSFDHIIYGWVFFGIVMIIVMAVGWRYFDRRVDEPWIPDVKPDGRKTSSVWSKAGALLALGITIIVAQSSLAAMGRVPMPKGIDLPVVPGWTRVDPVHVFPWQPRFDGADHRLWGQYLNAKGERVDVVIALYAWQGEGRKIVGFGQGAFDPESNWSWTAATAPPRAGRADRIFAPGAAREVASFYVIGGIETGSASRVKLATLQTRMLGQDQAAVAVLVSGEETKTYRPRPAIDAFLKALGPIKPLADKLVQTARGTQ
jgi:exosortase A